VIVGGWSGVSVLLSRRARGGATTVVTKLHRGCGNGGAEEINKEHCNGRAEERNRGHGNEETKNEFINELHMMMEGWQGPTLVGGDFNLVRNQKEKSNGNINFYHANNFSD
jgi:hypothetical protein